MKNLLLLTLFFFCSITFAQKFTDIQNEQKVIYKGFKTGMTKSEAKKEFNRDKTAYQHINLENGGNYSVIPNLYSYDKNDKIIGIFLGLDGTAKNKSATTDYFDNAKAFFEKHGYKFSFTPVSSRMYHVVMTNTEKNTIVEMQTTVGGLPLFYFITIRILNYDEFVKTDYYIKMAKTANFENVGKNSASNDTGF